VTSEVYERTLETHYRSFPEGAVRM